MSLRSQTIRGIAIPIVIAAVSIGGLARLQGHVDGLKLSDRENELLYFPNEKLLKYFTSGLNNVVADFMWYRTVQYTAQQFRSRDSKFKWLEHMTRTVTTLDPHYVDAYRYGGLFLALIGASDVSVSVLREGFVNNPNSWEIPFELHTIYLMSRDDDPVNRIIASRYALLVAERHDEEYKQRYIEIAQGLLSGNDMHDEAIELLTMAVKNADDDFLRTLAEGRLLRALIEKDLYVLRKAASKFESKFGKPIMVLDDLVSAGLISALPANEDDGEYFVDELGRVRNSIIVDEYETRTRTKILRHVLKFKEQYGRSPRDLNEVVTARKGRPYRYPLPGRDWHYDSESDELSVVSAR